MTRVLVVGAARSGVAAARALVARGDAVRLHDRDPSAAVDVPGGVELVRGDAPVDALLAGIDVKHVLVDFHAEATSEKVAMGWHLDGRVTAVVGTHTHVPTADARVLPGGTAYITDVGMTGPRGGVLGVKKEQSIQSLRTHMNVRYETSEEDPWINAVVIRCAESPRRAEAIEQVLAPWRPGPRAAGRS